MLNGAARKAIYAVIGTLFVLSVGGVATFIVTRASASSVEENEAGIAANTARIALVERQTTNALHHIATEQARTTDAIDRIDKALGGPGLQPREKTEPIGPRAAGAPSSSDNPS